MVTANDDDQTDPETELQRHNSKKTGKFKKVSLTDPDASMATSGRNRRLEPSYKQHSVVDDEMGVVLDLAVTTGEVNEGEQMLERLDAAAAATGKPIATVTADAGYAINDETRVAEHFCKIRAGIGAPLFAMTSRFA